MMSGNMEETNVEVKYWLIGVLKNNISDKITPKNREILQVYHFKLLANKENSGKILSSLISELVLECDRLGLITYSKNTLRKRVLLLIQEYKLLQKNENSTADWQLNRVRNFEQKLSEVFKIFTDDPIKMCENRSSK
jgi:hypothetical protein